MIDTSAPSLAIASNLILADPFGIYTTDFCLNLLATQATPLPWLPSVAVTNVTSPNCFFTSSDISTLNGNSLISLPNFWLRYFPIAYEPPSTLNAFNPNLFDSSFNHNFCTP